MGVYSRLVEARSAEPIGSPDDVTVPGGGGDEAPAIGQAVSNVGDRIQEILDTAERIAREIRAEAEAAAGRYLHERKQEADRLFDQRVRELGDTIRTLTVRAERLEREAAFLVEALGDANKAMAGLTDAAEPELVAKEPPRPTAAKTGRIPEQALLRATQMAVAGTDRAEIERMLRADFGIEDPSLFVDAMLRSERA